MNLGVGEMGFIFFLWLTSFPCDKNSGERSRDHWPSSFTSCMLGNLSCISQLTFSKKSFRNIFRVLKGLDPDQDQCSVGSDLGTNCLQISQQMTKVATKQGKSLIYYILQSIGPVKQKISA